MPVPILIRLLNSYSPLLVLVYAKTRSKSQHGWLKFSSAAMVLNANGKLLQSQNTGVLESAAGL
jgi:hypothetical protein